MDEKQFNEFMQNYTKLNGDQFLEFCIASLIRLRKGFTGDAVTQAKLNDILTTLYDIKY